MWSIKEYWDALREKENCMVIKVFDNVKVSRDNYVLPAYLDIARAFGNAWWAKIFVQLKDFL